MKSIKAKITKLSLKPGETILVRIKGKISDEQKDRLAEELKAGMPGLTSALIIPDDIRIDAVGKKRLKKILSKLKLD